MKRVLLAISLLAFAACGGNKAELHNPNLLSTSLVTNPHTANGLDSVTMADKPTMDFKDTVHDFGNLKDGEIGQYDFEFTNNGKTPLIITQATGSCGCTIAEFPHTPIAAGKTGVMKAKFNSAGKSGHEEKSITITSNAKRGVQFLYIKAEVTPSKDSKTTQLD